MEIAFTVKNMPRALKPQKDDVLIYDGQLWYITTKTELFREYDEHFNEKLNECNQKLLELQQEKEQLLADLNEFKAVIARQMLEYGQLIREVVLREGDPQ